MASKRMLLVAVAALLPLFGFVSQDVARRPFAGLVGAWTFDHADARDLSPYGGDLTLVGSPTLDTFLQLNGSTQHAYVADADRFTFTPGNPFSISAWVRFDVGSKNQAIAAKRSSNAGTSVAEWIFVVNGSDQLSMFLYRPNNAAATGQATTASLSVSTWHHVAAVYDGGTTASSVTLYIDGQLAASSSSGYGSGFAGMSDTTIPVTVGAQSGSVPLNWDGDIDGLLIINRELTANQVAQLHAQGRR